MQASTTYDPGSVTARTSGHGESFLSADQLRKLIALRLSQNAAAAAPARGGGGRAMAYDGPAPVLRENVTGGGGADMSGAMPGRHSFVQNMGGFGTVGGFVETPEAAGGRVVYGGHRVTDGGGPVRLQEGGGARGPAIGWDFADPAEQQERATAGLPGNALRHDMSRRLAIANMLRRGADERA